MSKDNPEASPKRVGGRVSIGQLMRGGSILDQIPPQSLIEISRKLDAISAKAYARILRIAGRMDTPDEVRSLLPSLLAEIGVDLPPGVLKPAPGRPGRPRKPDNAKIYDKWLTEGRPGPGSQTFVRACFGKTFGTADPREKKRMIDRCYRTIKRMESTKSTAK